MIELVNLTKKYGGKTVVNKLNLNLKSGVITGFLGPNGSGKSTTMKMIISLVHPTVGEVRVDGKKYNELTQPTKQIGTLIDPAAIDKNLTARQHLSLISTASNIEPNRVDEMIKITGLEMVQNNKVKSYSLGMKQRLGVATALISDPDVVILDEPFNGLDVDGIKWLRRLFKLLAEEGKAVIVSSHLMSEIQAVADRVVIIGQGKLLADMTIEEMNKKSLSSYVYVEANDIEKMAKVLREKQAIVQKHGEGLEIRNLEAKRVGRLAYDNQIVLYELKKVQPTLEELFTEITYGKVDYVSQGVEN
ncbi:MAG TPA: ATP-binding cassette domain-containing protein [Virgibacillus sp.]|nr:ATP-binding cassette domain-containing protein [Virgibacillus sp.]